MIEAISLARAFAPAATPVILYGESGTGKTFFAEFIHQVSERPGGSTHSAWVSCRRRSRRTSCSGMCRVLLRTPTRCVRADRVGWQWHAAAGRLTHARPRGAKQLLQVLDRGTYSAVGGDRVQTVACRMVFAMTEDPDTLMTKGLLLRDLRYRFGEWRDRDPGAPRAAG